MQVPGQHPVRGHGRAYGQMILQLPEDERAAKRALAYLETQNIHAEEVNEYAPA